jgi:dTDP-4-amino-4,6-dideoxygalactose transaminase
MTRFQIPYTRATVTPHEGQYASEAIHSLHLQGDGPFTKKAEALLEKQTGAQKALLTSSCTDALEMAVILSDIGQHDEVIMPSYTFVSTANAVALRGGTCVFVDIEPHTINLDLDQVERAITPKTKAIIPVHYAGISCHMEKLVSLAKKHHLTIIEDAAHGIGATYKGRPLGSIGDLSALSFHQTKNITCGEGGALLINNSKFLDRAEVIREKGTNRRQFLRGEVDKYTWVDVGSSFLPSDLIAAVLCSQLESAPAITEKRAHLFLNYFRGLKNLADAGNFSLPTIPDYSGVNGHIFYLIMPSFDHRERLKSHLQSQGIKTTSHYEPLHQAPASSQYSRLPHGLTSLPVTEKIGPTLLRLPLYFDLTEAEQSYVMTAITQFYS